MTLAECRASHELTITAQDVAAILDCSAQAIRAQAQEDPAKLGFPVIVTGTRVRIPRKPFLKFLGEND